MDRYHVRDTLGLSVEPSVSSFLWCFTQWGTATSLDAATPAPFNPASAQQPAVFFKKWKWLVPSSSKTVQLLPALRVKSKSFHVVVEAQVTWPPVLPFTSSSHSAPTALADLELPPNSPPSHTPFPAWNSLPPNSYLAGPPWPSGPSRTPETTSPTANVSFQAPGPFLPHTWSVPSTQKQAPGSPGPRLAGLPLFFHQHAPKADHSERLTGGT